MAKKIVVEEETFEPKPSKEDLEKMSQVEEYYASRTTLDEIIERLTAESEAKQVIRDEKKAKTLKAYEELVALGLSTESAAHISGYKVEEII